MSSCYYCGSVPMKPEMENIDLICEDDECSFKVPNVYFEGTSESYEEDPIFNWDTDSVVVVKDQCVIKYTESTYFEILLKDKDGESTWLDGRQANILGADVENVDDTRIVKEYWIEEFDLKKSEKRKYKVVLEETSTINEYDHYTLQNFLKEENDAN